MNKVRNNLSASEQFQYDLLLAMNHYYNTLLSLNIQAGIQAKKRKLLSKAK